MSNRQPAPEPTARPFVRAKASGPFWYAKWSRDGRPVMRSLGRAWVESDGSGGWKPRRGRARDGALTEAAAGARMLELSVSTTPTSRAWRQMRASGGGAG